MPPRPARTAPSRGTGRLGGRGGAGPAAAALRHLLALLASAALAAGSAALAQAAPGGPVRDVTATVAWQPERIAQGLPRGAATAWGQGEDLIVAYHGTADAVRLCCGLQAPLHRLGDHDVWVLMARVAGLERAVLGLELHVRHGEASWTVPLPEGGWRGPAAPGPAATLRTVRTFAVESEALGGARTVSVYRPPIDPGRPPRWVVYAPDGQALERWAPTFEALIARGCTEPFHVVAPHALAGTARWEEYVPGRDPAAFDAHARFLAEELPAWARRELGVASEPERTALLGTSNGADLVLELSRRHPDRYGAVVAFSAGTASEASAWRGVVPGARYYLTAGTLEPSFYGPTLRTAALLRDLGAEVAFRPRVAGHDPFAWEDELAPALAWALAGDADLARTCTALGDL